MSQDSLPVKSMKDSLSKAIIPLSTDPRLLLRYTNIHGTVRIGRILEDLDTMAGYICYKHNLRPEKDINQIVPLSTVTACVDSIHLHPTKFLDPSRDIFLSGFVSCVGSSSMEVSLQVEQEHAGEVSNLMNAKFIMVARNPIAKGKAYVCPLKVESPEEQAIVDQGKENKNRLRSQSAHSLLKVPPSEEERLLVHKLFLSTVDVNAVTFKKPVKPENSVWMADTSLKNIYICFPEQRNIHKKIFGGFVMRMATELAFINACVFSKTRPEIIFIDDIIFRKPVEIGSLIYFSSQVSYTQDSFIQIRVHAEVVNPMTNQHETTNTFHYTFTTRGKASPAVIPNSYAEYMIYLDGKRHFELSEHQIHK